MSPDQAAALGIALFLACLWALVALAWHEHGRNRIEDLVATDDAEVRYLHAVLPVPQLVSADGHPISAEDVQAASRVLAAQSLVLVGELHHAALDAMLARVAAHEGANLDSELTRITGGEA